MNDSKIHEPAWLIAAVDQRVAHFQEKLRGRDLSEFDVITLLLTEPMDAPTPSQYRHWDESCDNCLKYVPGRLISQVVEREMFGLTTMITVGACRKCWCLP